MQIADGLLEVLRALLVVAHHGLYGSHDMGAGVYAEFMVVVQRMLLHVLGRQLSPVALLTVGEVECLVGPGLVECAFVASLLGSLLQAVGHVHEGRLVVFVIELVHLFLQLSYVIGSRRLCPRLQRGSHQKQDENDVLCHIFC